MMFISVWKQRCATALVCYGIAMNVYASLSANPCAGPSELLNLLDRPTVGDSACVVPYNNAIIESGYQFQKLAAKGYAQNFPEAVVRIGLPANNEFVIILPNYIQQFAQSRKGFSAATLGIKHELSYNIRWVMALEALFTLPSGAPFGSGLDGAVNGIINYNFTTQISVTGMLGVSTQEPRHQGGQRFTSINPDLVLSWLPNPQTELYAEIYGQSKISDREGSGFNMDAGIIYVFTRHCAADFELGQSISNNFGGFKHYIGVGLSIML
jgi:hypothetical protein